jgi:hypothetical protein
VNERDAIPQPAGPDDAAFRVEKVTQRQKVDEGDRRDDGEQDRQADQSESDVREPSGCTERLAPGNRKRWQLELIARFWDSGVFRPGWLGRIWSTTSSSTATEAKSPVLTETPGGASDR